MKFFAALPLLGNAGLVSVAPTKFDFVLSDLLVTPIKDNRVQVSVGQTPLMKNRGEPALPVFREAVILPHLMGNWDVIVSNAEYSEVPLYGQKVEPATGNTPICAQREVAQPNMSSVAYQGVYPTSDQVSLETPHQWRDVYGAVLQVQPVVADHENDVLKVLKKATVELVNKNSVAQPNTKVIDPDFHDVYSVVYSNFDHYSSSFVRGDKIGRTLIVHGSQFKSHAQEYAEYVKELWAQESLILEAAESADEIKSAIKQHFAEDEGLSYVMIIGRDVPTPRGSETDSECDNCYAMINGETLDVFVGRLSGATAEDIETQLAKFKTYIKTSHASWNQRAHGSCYPAPWDPTGYEQLFKDMMQEFGDMGFSQHEYVLSSAQGAGQKALEQMDSGIGVFGYIGHGSGTAWNTPSMDVYDVQGLTNTDKHFLELDCSCLNGGFQSHSPSLAEALLTSKGGAVATMMSAPTIDTCCLDYLRAAPQVLASAKVKRVGPMFVASLAKAQVAAPDRARTQSYNVFADPSLELAFWPSQMNVAV